MKLKVLGSSSSGNCYILKSDTGSLLLECGLPWNQIQKGLDYDLSDIQGCLITHSHKDHCKAIMDVIKAGIDVYTSFGTSAALGIKESHRVYYVSNSQQSRIGSFTVLPFDTQHDADEPLGYLIFNNKTGEKLLFATDTYYIKYRFNNLNYISVECNYIKDTLDYNVAAGYIPEEQKRRLLSSHFSLEHVKEFLQANDLSQCRKIILLHLSDRNSDAARMVKEIQELTNIETVIANPGEIDLNLYPY
jgi:phosphoribosyl 1,2-cyclic phosphodiesterase